ncbi:MAG: GDSL-type esterase/lipase family protein [Myxococcales bacterium]
MSRQRLGWWLAGGCVLGSACAHGSPPPRAAGRLGDAPKTAEASGSSEPLRPLRILALGDSITQGRAMKSADMPATQSWRYPFWKELLTTGVAFDMVGGLAHGFEGDPAWPSVEGVAFDREHEARWGFRLDEMTEILRKDIERLQSEHFSFDVVMVLLGGNDLDQKETLSELWPEWDALFALLRARNPQVKVAVGVYCHDFGGSAEYRAELTRRAPSWSTAESTVVIANGCENWVADPRAPGTDTVDWIHPNAQGDQKIARGFLQSLRALRPDSFAPSQGTPASLATSAPVTLTK